MLFRSEFEKYASDISPIIGKLAEAFCPGPLTFVLKKKDNIPDIVTGGGPTVALRIPDHPMTIQLLKELDFPLAAPSANPFGYISPVTAEHVKEQLDGKISYILDGGPCDVGIESTVVTMRDDVLTILRLGGISAEALRSVYPNIQFEINRSSNPSSPGQLASHYAPHIDFLLGDISDLINKHSDKKIAVLSFTKPYRSANIILNEVLSPSGSTKEAAHNLFAAMRRLDACGADLIIAERVPDEGLGLAVNDRLTRAAAKS